MPKDAARCPPPLRRGLCLALPAWLAGCASPIFDIGVSETVLPLQRAWFEGRRVEYVTTDVSDAAMAAAMGVNHTPRLADAVGAPSRFGVLERVYKFAAGEQINVFPSAPTPAGPGNRDTAYSPLWRIVMVHWQRPANRRELRSEEQVLAAEQAGEVSLTVTDIVVNCPVVRDGAGRPLRGVR